MSDKMAACIRTFVFAIATFAASIASASLAAAQTNAGQTNAGQATIVPKYTPDGQLLAPVGYETWVFVGSNLGLAYQQASPARAGLESIGPRAPQFHNVYINPEAYAHFRATGEFPDPTILVMDRFAAADKEPRGIVSNGVFNGDRRGFEVAVKNLSRPDGRTTAWAYYDFTDASDPTKTRAAAPAFPDEACESCHRQHASKDNVWVQFYPVLRSALK